MKKILIAAVLLALSLPFGAAGQDAAAQLQDFTRLLKVADGLQLSIVHVNGRTVLVLFQPPTLYAIRARAKEVTVFFVQGTPEKDVNLDPSGFTVQQGGESSPLTPVNIKRFEKGKVIKGDRIDGMLQLAKQLDVAKPFTVVHAKESVEFKFTDDQVKSMDPPPPPAQ
jgi:phenylpropionate dioxygenase-like ring-hydroxylating dioxygenase large terminal subunit